MLIFRRWPMFAYIRRLQSRTRAQHCDLTSRLGTFSPLHLLSLKIQVSIVTKIILTEYRERKLEG